MGFGLLSFVKHVLNVPRGEKTCLQRCANIKGADQPARPRSLISAFVISFLESNISKLPTDFLASLCSWGDWFESHFVRNPEDRFCHVEAHMTCDNYKDSSYFCQFEN